MGIIATDGDIQIATATEYIPEKSLLPSQCERSFIIQPSKYEFILTNVVRIQTMCSLIKKSSERMSILHSQLNIFKCLILPYLETKTQLGRNPEDLPPPYDMRVSERQNEKNERATRWMSIHEF